MRMDEHPNPFASAGVTLRRRLDRGVAAVTIIRFLGWSGRFAMLACVGVAAAEILPALIGWRAHRWLIGIVVLLTAVAAWWRWAGRPPTRLDVALAMEGAHPELRERVSRAVPFLEPSAKGMHDPALTTGLRELALADADRAVAAVPRLPLPGFRTNAVWAMAGSLAIVALLALVQDVPQVSPEGRSRHEPSAAKPVGEPAAMPTIDLTAVASRLATAAAVESRLAETLAMRFAAAPGQTADSLSDEQRRQLATLAGIHDDALHAVHCVREELEAIDAPVARTATQQLGAIDAGASEAVGEAIVANRLASAASGTKQLADSVVAVVEVLGGGTLDPAEALPHLPPRERASVRRAEAALAEIGRRPVDGRQDAPFRATSSAGRQEGGEQPMPSPGGETNSIPTSDPRFTAGDAEIQQPADAATRAADRIWSLFPEKSRPYATRGGGTDVSPDYSAVVDLYYTLILESLRSEPTGKPTP